MSDAVELNANSAVLEPDPSEIEAERISCSFRKITATKQVIRNNKRLYVYKLKENASAVIQKVTSTAWIFESPAVFVGAKVCGDQLLLYSEDVVKLESKRKDLSNKSGRHKAQARTIDSHSGAKVDRILSELITKNRITATREINSSLSH